MPWMIGIDEAGYGPKLGPLVVAATVWEVSSNDAWNAYSADALADERGRGPSRGGSQLAAFGGRSSDLAVGHIAIADSKTLFKSCSGLGGLERGVLAALATMGKTPTSWRELVAALGADPNGGLAAAPWFRHFDCELPIDTPHDECERLASRFAEAHSTRRVRAMRARLVGASEFNTLVTRFDNKANLLTRVSLELLRNALKSVPANDRRALPVFVVCDKHGGRKRYAPALQQRFPDTLVEVRGESQAESRYLFGPSERRIDVRFRKGGEAFPPTALASMTAKFLRELAMRAFNAFWRCESPSVRATAGYPVDAERFKREIEGRRIELGIDDALLWRLR